MKEPRTIRKPVAIAVEGLDYFYALLSQLDGPPEFADVELWDFSPVGSPERWLRLFRTLIPGYAPGVRAIGLIRDAENSATARQKELQKALRQNGFAVPDRPLDITIGPPATGFLIIPHGKPSGCLENALLEGIQPLMPLNCAQAFLTCVDQPAKNSNWRAKVLVHSLIAATDNPSMTLGQSAQAGKYWDFAHPSLQVMLTFIRSLVHATPPPTPRTRPDASA